MMVIWLPHLAMECGRTLLSTQHRTVPPSDSHRSMCSSRRFLIQLQAVQLCKCVSDRIQSSITPANLQACSDRSRFECRQQGNGELCIERDRFFNLHS